MKFATLMALVLATATLAYADEFDKIHANFGRELKAIGGAGALEILLADRSMEVTLDDHFGPALGNSMVIEHICATEGASDAEVWKICTDPRTKAKLERITKKYPGPQPPGQAADSAIRAIEKLPKALTEALKASQVDPEALAIVRQALTENFPHFSEAVGKHDSVQLELAAAKLKRAAKLMRIVTENGEVSNWRSRHAQCQKALDQVTREMSSASSASDVLKKQIQNILSTIEKTDAPAGSTEKAK